jgi:alpha-tubulin suppressor-like RCC1 family protein
VSSRVCSNSAFRALVSALLSTVSSPGKEAKANQVKTIDVRQASGLTALLIFALAQGSANGAGIVVAWGDNSFGQTAVPPGLSNIVSISAGARHSLALRRDGTVIAWGDNSSGQTNVPPGLTNVISISACNFHNLALTADGTVVAWGSDTNGESEVPANLTNVVAVAAGGSHSLVLRRDGSMVAWGDTQYGQTGGMPGGLNNVIAIAAGPLHSIAVKADGTIAPWWNVYGAPDYPPETTNVVAAAVGGGYSLALKGDGTVVSWGAFSPGVPVGLTNVAAVAAQQGTGLALKRDGTVVAWGDNSAGQANVPPGLSNVTAMAAGGLHNLALVGGNEPSISWQPGFAQVAFRGQSIALNVGAVGAQPLSYQWRFNDSAIPSATNPVLRLPNVDFPRQGNYEAIITNAYGSVTSLNASVSISELLSWGYTRTNVLMWPGFSNVVAIGSAVGGGAVLGHDGIVYGLADLTPIPGMTNGVAIALGDYHGLVLKNDGTMVGWGGIGYGEGDIPPGLSNVVAIAAGALHSLALKKDGTVVAWGDNASGQCNVPAGLKNVIALAGGSYFSLALKSDGTVIGWGNNQNGQLNIPPGLGGVVAISAGAGHSAALTSSGDVVVWGSNTYGQRTVPAGLSDVVWVSCGALHTMALRRDGVLFSWGQYWDGNSSYTPAYIPYGVSNVTAIANNIQYSPFILVSLGDGSPAIVRTSLAQTVATNATVSFNVAAVGTPPLSYQWRSHGTNIPGATDTSLTLSSVQMSDAGNYSVLVSNVPGTCVSSDIALDVLDLARALSDSNFTWNFFGDAPWLSETSNTLDSAAAQSGPIGDGQQSTLETTATGPGTLQFWWKVSSEAGHDFLSFSINGAAAASISGSVDWQQQTLYLPDGPLDLRWTYAKDVSGAAGSDAGWLDQVVFAPGPTLPTITTGPANRTIPAGSTVTFNAAAFGTPSLSYQWQFFGTNLPGATNTSLALVDVQSANAGTYSVVVTNGYGSAVSNAVLTVSPAVPRLTLSPTRQHVLINRSATFSAAATGSEPLSFQWRLNGTNIAGATASVLTFTGLQVSNSGTIQVVVSNAVGSATNRDPTTLLVSPTLVLAWGNDFSGQIEVPFTLTNVVNIAAGQSSGLALNADGTVVAWGQTFAQVPAGLTNAAAIAAGWGHNLALKSNGTVVAWGNNTSGQLNIPAGLSNVIAIAAGGYHSLALKNNGTVVAWGHNAYGQATVPAGLSNVVAVAAGNYLSLALKADGTVVGWGNNQYGQTNIPAGLSNVVAISAGYTHAIALKADRTIAGWGNNNYGQTVAPDPFTNIVALAAGGYHNLILDSDGNAGGWGYNIYGQATPPATATNVMAVGAGVYHSIALVRYEPLRTAPSLDANGSRMTAAGFSLRIAGLSGHGPVIVYSSADLRTWAPLWTNQPWLGSLQFLDSSATNQASTFYRVAEQ